MNGVLIIDKPAGMTSHDVVERVRRLLGERSVGHLGTLDPMATGLLPLVTGRLTRLAQFYTQAEKSYEGVIRFGFATDTYDADGDPLGEPQPVSLTLEQVREAAARFRGEIEQMPPPFSAKKIAGVPAYKLARKKKEVELKPVTVEIKEFEILALEGDRATFRSRVASGTYLRSVAHDLGKALGTGAHLASLRRTSVAEFDMADAVTLDALAEVMSRLPHPSREGGNFDESAIPFVHPRRILPAFPAVSADEETAGKIRHGRAVNLPELSKARMVKVFEGQRELLCIAQRVAGTLFQPKVVLL
jgi:tRNA pseudouridine55 synthase